MGRKADKEGDGKRGEVSELRYRQKTSRSDEKTERAGRRGYGCVQSKTKVILIQLLITTSEFAA